MIYWILILVVFLALSFLLFFKERRKSKYLSDSLSIQLERKKAVRETLEMLMDHSSDFYFRYNKTGYVNYSSSNVERLLGFKKDDGPVHFSKILTDNHINKDLPTRIERRFNQNLKESDSYFLEVKDKFEQVHMLEIFETPHLNLNGGVDYVNAIARDLTSIYQAEMDLKEIERQQNLILESIPDSLFMIDRELKYVDYQATNEEQLWYKPSQFIGKRVKDVVPEHLKDLFTNALTEAFESGEIQTLEYYFNQGESREFFEGRIVKLNENQVLVISRNITNDKRLERELRKAKEAAESATQAKSIFLATMSHEIRTPMNGVVGMISLLAETKLSEDQKEYVETIQASGDTLLRIINDILDYSRIESGKLSFEESLFYLQKVIDDSLGLFKFEAQKKGIILNAVVDEEVPNFIRTDRSRLRQVLLNLLSNAVKFTENGSIILSVEVESKDEQNVRLLFKVKDTGMGIPKEKLDGLFEEFTQVDSSHTRKFGGTGLGLAIVKKLVKMLHGKVQVESTLGVGSVFSFTMTAKLAAGVPVGFEEGSQKEEAQKEQDFIEPQYPLNILLAEDNSVNRKLSMLFLERMGYIPDTVEDGHQVLQALKKKSYDVVLLDIALPGLDGYEVTELIPTLNLEKNPMIIGISANAHKSDIEKAYAIGMSSYIVKPIKFEDLRENLKNAYLSIQEPSL